MKNLIIASAAIIAFAAPVANASDFDEVEVTIEYQPTQLETETGTNEILETIREEAFEACRYTEPNSPIQRVDTRCVASITSDALAKIEQSVAQTSNGGDLATVVASAATRSL